MEAALRISFITLACLLLLVPSYVHNKGVPPTDSSQHDKAYRQEPAYTSPHRQQKLPHRINTEDFLENVAKIRANVVEERAHHRSKRWDYDRNYDWENEGADEYGDATGPDTKKETKLEKWAQSWQKHALRFIFIFSVIMMFVCCCCGACKKFLGLLCSVIMMHIKDWRDICLNRDPTFRMLRKQADEYGIELDYEQYTKIKNAYDQGLKKHGYSNVDISGR